MTGPRVSVVMPSLNHGRFLAAAIDSVLAQRDPDLELLVIDGGSVDDSVRILESYGDRIRFSSARDRGQGHAINVGMQRARGDIVAWLNADDRYTPGAVAAAVAALDQYPRSAFVYGHASLIDDAGGGLGPFHANRPFEPWTLRCVHNYIPQPTVFVRRDCWRSVGGVDETLRYCLDWDLWLRLSGCWPVAYLPRLQAEMREHAASKTARGGRQRWREIRTVLQRHGAPRGSPAHRIYHLDSLRRRWPVVFGAGSRADQERLRHQLLPRLFLPVHASVSWAIARQLRRQQSLPVEVQPQGKAVEFDFARRA